MRMGWRSCLHKHAFGDGRSGPVDALSVAEGGASDERRCGPDLALHRPIRRLPSAARLAFAHGERMSRGAGGNAEKPRHAGKIGNGNDALSHYLDRIARARSSSNESGIQVEGATDAHRSTRMGSKARARVSHLSSSGRPRNTQMGTALEPAVVHGGPRYDAALCQRVAAGLALASLMGTTRDPAWRGSRRTPDSGPEALSCVDRSP